MQKYFNYLPIKLLSFSVSPSIPLSAGPVGEEGSPFLCLVRLSLLTLQLSVLFTMLSTRNPQKMFVILAVVIKLTHH